MGSTTTVRTTKNDIDRTVKALLEEFKKECAMTNTNLRRFVADAASFGRTPGKRFRSLLTMLSYDAYRSTSSPALSRKSVLRIASSFEILHAFLLIHDDVIDKSALRRGLPSMHKTYEQYFTTADKTVLGESLAITAGDLLFTFVQSVVASEQMPLPLKMAVQRELNQGIMKTCLGEAFDIFLGSKHITAVSADDIRTMLTLKTAHYTVEMPLVVGAILAGAPQKDIAILRSVGIKLGLAFQIQDDVLGLFGTQQQIGKSILSDVKEGKKTLLVNDAYQRATREEKAFIDSCLGNASLTPSMFKKLQRLVEDKGSRKKTQDEIIALVNSCKTLINHLNADKEKIAPLYAITDKLVHRNS